MDVHLTRCDLCLRDGLGEAADEDEVVTRRLLLGMIGDDEERYAPRIDVTPVPGGFVSRPSADYGADLLHGLVEPRLVFAGRSASDRRVVAPSPPNTQKCRRSPPTPRPQPGPSSGPVVNPSTDVVIPAMTCSQMPPRCIERDVRDKAWTAASARVHRHCRSSTGVPR
jgi:hypothetical protein